MFSSVVRRHSVIVFVLLTVALSFAAYLLPLPREAVPFVMVLMPALVALLLAAVADGRAGVRALLARLGPRRAGWKWLALALGLALVLRLLLAALALLLGLIPALRLRPLSPLEMLMFALLFVLAALPEELGWRGYALPPLLARRSPAAAAVVLGLPWGLVHLALHLPGMPSDGLPWLPTLVQLVSLSVLLAWFFVRGGQSVALTTLFHAAQSFFVVANEGVSLAAAHWLMALVWAGAALAVVAVDRAMRRRPAPEPAAPAARRPGRALVWAGRGLLGLSAAALLLGLVGSGAQDLAGEVDRLRYPPPGRLVDVGGYNLHIHCTGQGEPTVILDAASLGGVSSWYWVQTELSRSTRVCSYDRPGLGWSDLGPEPRDARQNAEQLHALLAGAGIDGPYVLVGHSFGGLYVRAYAARYPRDVAGVVLVEGTLPDLWQRRGEPEVMPNADEGMLSAGPAAARLGLFRLLTFVPPDPDLPAQQQAEMAAYFRSNKFADRMLSVYRQFPNLLAQARALHDLGDVPLLIVLGAGSENATGLERQMHDETLALSSRARQRLVDGADHISLLHNQAHARGTTAAILELVTLVREDN